MSNEDLKNELIDCIKEYEKIVYMYDQYPTYNNTECSYLDAVQRLDYYKEEFNKQFK